MLLKKNNAKKVQSFTSFLKIKEYQFLIIAVLGIIRLYLKGLNLFNVIIKFSFVKQIQILRKHRNSVLRCGDHSNRIHQDRGTKSANKSFILPYFVLAATSRNG